MAISFSGLASGLDTSQWVESLTALKRAKVTKYEEKKEAINVSKSALSYIQQYFVAFRSSISRITESKLGLNNADLFSQKLAVSSNTNKLLARATSEAEEKTYNITVDKLATLTKAKSQYKDTITTTSKATETSRLENIEGYKTTTTASTGIMNIDVNVDGVKHSLTIRKDDNMDSIVSKFQAIGVDARYNQTSGKLSLNTSLSSITGTGAADFKELFHLDGVNEGYETGKLQYSSIKTTQTDAVLDTKISQLIANREDLAALGIGSDYLNSAKTVNVQNSTNNNITTFTVNSNTRIGDFINQLKSAGLYATLNNDGCLEITGGQIVGGTFDAVSVFGLTEEPESAMVTGNMLTETIIVPDIVDLNTKLVEDLGVTRGFFEVKNPDSDTFYLSIYSGQTMADLISDLGHVGIDGDLDSQTGVLTLRGGEYRTLTDSEVIDLCASNTIVGVDDEHKKGTNLLSSLGLDVEANMHILSTRSRSRALTYSQVNYMTSDATISDFVNLPLDRTLVVHEHTGEAIGTVTVNNTTTFDQLFADLSRYDVDGEIHDGIVMFDSNRELYVTGDLLTELGMSTTYETITETTTLGATQSTSAKTYQKPEYATAESVINDFLTIDNTNNQLVVKDRDGNATGTVTVTNTMKFSELFAALNPLGVHGDIGDGRVSFTDNDGGYVDGTFAAALGVNTNYTTVTTTSTVGGTQTTTAKTFSIVKTATDDDLIKDYVTASGVINVKDGNGAIVGTVTLNNSMTFADLFGELAEHGVDGDLHDGVVTFVSGIGGYVDGTGAERFGVTTSYNTIVTTATVGRTQTTAGKSYETIKVAEDSDLIKDYATASGDLVVHDQNGNATGTVTLNNTMTFSDMFQQLGSLGVQATLHDGIVTLVHNSDGYVDGTGAENLGLMTTYNTVTITATIGSVQTTGTKTYTQNVVATDGSTINDFITISGSNNKIVVHDIDGDATQTVTVDGTKTFGELFASLAEYGVNGDIEDGRITFTTDNNGYVDGSFVTAMGVNTSYTTITTVKTVGSTTTGSGLNYESEQIADDSSVINDFLTINSGNNKLVIKDHDGEATQTVTVDGSQTFGELFASLAQYGVDGDIENGQVTFIHNEGGYVDGSFTGNNGLKMSTSYTTVKTTTTVGTTQSTDQKTYSVTQIATDTSVIGDFISVTNANNTIVVHSSDGTPTATVNVDGTKTFGELFASLAEYGVDGDIENGQVTFIHNNGGYVDGSFAAALNMTTTYDTVATTTTVGTTQSTTQKTYSVTQVATNTSTINDYVSVTNANRTIVVHASDGTATATVNVDGTKTFGELFASLAEYGVDGDIENGQVTFIHNNGGYVDGSFAAALNMTTTYDTVATTTTVGTTQTTDQKLYSVTVGTTQTLGQKTYSVTQVATDTSVINDFVSVTAANSTIVVHASDGTATATVNVNGSQTFGELFASLAQYGVDGDIENGRVTFIHNNGGYVDGSFTGANGLQMTTTYGTVTTTTTVGSSQSTGVRTYSVVVGTSQTTSQKTYSVTQVATDTSVINDFVSVTAANSTIVVHASDGTATATVNVDGTQTFGQLFATLAEYGVDGDIENGQVTFIHNNGGYVDGSFTGANGLNMTTSYTTVKTTTTIGATQSTGVMTYSVTVGATQTTATQTCQAAITEDMKLSDIYGSGYSSYINTSGGYYTRLCIKNSSGTIDGYITLRSLGTNATVGNLFSALEAKGFECSLEDGVISINSADGKYIEEQHPTGTSILDKMGIGLTYGQAVSTTASAGTNITIDGTITASGVTGTVIGISTAADLQNLATLVNNGTTMNGKTFVLTDDIDLSGIANWTSIGKDGYKIFYGTFDGQGHTISGMTQSVNASSTRAGLFGNVGGTVKNLNLEGNIVGDSAEVAMLAYSTAGATIENVTTSGTITLTGDIKGASGVVGGAYGRGNISSSLNNISSSVDIIVEESSTGPAAAGSSNRVYIAGICRWGYSEVDANNLVYSGNIDIRKYDSYICTGGIYGYYDAAHSSNITNCAFTGSISNANFYNAGGIASFVECKENNTQTLSNCYVTGSITNNHNEVSGALIGNHTNYYNSSTLNISNCYTSTSNVPYGRYSALVNQQGNPSTVVYNVSNVRTGKVMYDGTAASGSQYDFISSVQNPTSNLVFTDNAGTPELDLLINQNNNILCFTKAVNTIVTDTSLAPNVYTINSAEDFIAFKQLCASTDTTGKTFVLTSDINLTLDDSWSGSTAFKGVFDGQGHTISFTQTRDISTNGNIGFFGDLWGTVKNLNVESDTTITQSGGDSNIIGGILARHVFGTIDNVNLSGSISIDSSVNTTTAQQIGGMARELDANATIKNSSVNVTITSSQTGHNNNQLIAGLAYYACNDVTIENCVVDVNTNGIDGYNYSDFIGQLITKSSSVTIKNCIVNGTSTNNNSTYKAGLIGILCPFNINGNNVDDINTLNLENCYVNSTINSANANLIGVIGNDTYGAHSDNNINIKNCYTKGNFAQGNYFPYTINCDIENLRCGNTVYNTDTTLTAGVTSLPSGTTAVGSYYNFIENTLDADNMILSGTSDNPVLTLSNTSEANSYYIQTVSTVPIAQTTYVTLAENATIGDVISTLQANGMNGHLLSDGSLEIWSEDGTIVSGLSLDNWGIERTAGGDYSISETKFTADKINGNTSSNRLTTSAYMDYDTSFEDLGYGAGSVSVRYNGNNYTISMRADNTIGDLIGTLSGYGISGSVSNDGKLTLTGNENSWITGATGCLGGGKLGLTASYTTETRTMTDDSTLGALVDFDIDTITPSYNGFIANPVTYTDIQVAGFTSLSTVSASTSITSGTYSISSTEDLAKLATMNNSGKIAGGTFVLANDIDLNNQEWSPIGTTDYRFEGTFDGNGHTISNFRINADSDCQGFFGCVYEVSYIKNVGIVNADITGSGEVGALVGILEGTIDNCYSTGTVHGEFDVGGLVGYSGPYIHVTNCYSTATVVSDGDICGGLIGYTTGGYVGNNYASGNVSGDTYIGGLVGYCSNTEVANCYALGDVSGYNGIGGFMGYADENTAIYNSYASKSESEAPFIGWEDGVYLSNSYSLSFVMDVVNAEKQTQKYTFNTNNTIGDIRHVLAANDISSTLNNGVLTLSGNGYISNIIGDFNPLGLSATSYTTSTVTAVQGTTTAGIQEIRTVTATMTSDTTFSELGYGAGSVTIVTNGTKCTVSMLASNTVGDLMTALAGYGFESEVRGGSLFVSGSSESYILSVTGGLGAGKLGLASAWTNETRTMTSDSTFSDLRLCTDGVDEVFKHVYTAVNASGQSHVATFGTSNTIGDVMNFLAANDIVSTIEDGELILQGGGGYIIGSTIIGDDGGGNWIDTGDYLAAKKLFNTTSYTTSTVTAVQGTTTAGVQEKRTILATMTSNTTLSELGFDTDNVYKKQASTYIKEDSKLTVCHEGVLYTITANSTQTVGDLMTALAGYGISSDIQNGSLTIVGTEDSYITAKSGIFKGSYYSYMALPGQSCPATFDSDGQATTRTGFGVSASYTTVTATMTSDTTFSQLGYAAGGVTVVSNGTTYTVSMLANNTVGDLMTALAGYGIESEVRGGSLFVTGTSEGYITGATGGLGAGKLGLAASYSTSTVTAVQGTTTAGVQEIRTITTSMTSDTTFSELGYAAGNVTVVSNGTTYTVSMLASNTVGDLMTALAGYGIESEVRGGSLFVTGTSEGYITGAYGGLGAGKLGLTSSYSTSTVTAVQGTTTAGVKEERTISATMTSDTTFSELGYAAGGVTVVSNGTTYTVSMLESNTVGDLMTALGGYGISSEIRGGSLFVSGTTDGYITGATGGLGAGKLGLASSYSTSTVTAVQGTTTAGIQEKRTVTISMTSSTTLAQLGKDGGTATINSNGTDYTITMSANNTIGDFIAAAAGLGITGSVSEDGKLTLTGSKYAYLKGLTGGLAELGLTQNNYTTSTITAVNGTNSGGDQINKDVTYSMTSDTTFDDIGIGAGTVTVKYRGTDYTVSMKADNTVGDLVSALAGFGISGTVHDGQLTLVGTQDAFITGATGGMGAGAGNMGIVYSYTTIPQTITQGTTSSGTRNVKNVTVSMSTSTTFDNLGLGSGTITVVSGGTTYTVTMNADNTIGDLIGSLGGYGIAGAVTSDGRLILTGNTNAYVAGATGSISALGISAAFNVGDSTIVQGYTTAGDKEIRTITQTMTSDTTFENLNLSAGSVVVSHMGVLHTVTMNTTNTIGDLVSALAGYGISGTISNDGKLTLNGSESGYIVSANGGLSALGIEQSTVTSTTTVVNGTNTTGIQEVRDVTKVMTLDTTLADLGLARGSISVKYGGDDYTINVAESNTIGDMLTALAGYGISGSIDPEGVLTVTGTYDGWITGTTGGVSALGLHQSITTTVTTTVTGDNGVSNQLTMDTTPSPVMKRNTKMVDLKDSSGNDLNISTGSYYIYEDGVRTTHEITEDTTVNDFMAEIANYGLVADIAEDGSIAVNGHNKSFMATSMLGAAPNSNVVDVLFSEWDFNKVYDSNGLEVPVATIEAISRNTKLADIAEASDTRDGEFKEGLVTLVKDGVQTHLYVNANDTVGTFLDELEMFGFNSVINNEGQVIIRAEGDSYLQAYENGSNILDILGVNDDKWVITKSYESGKQETITKETEFFNATEDTKLSDIAKIGDNTNIRLSGGQVQQKIGNSWKNLTGTTNVVVNGENKTINIDADDTLGSIVNKFNNMGLSASIVDGKIIVQSGYDEIDESASNITRLFTYNDDLAEYGGFVTSQSEVKSVVESNVSRSAANWANNDTTMDILNISNGTLSVYLNGVKAGITVETTDTFDDLEEKINEKLGANAVQVNVENGILTISSNQGDVTVGASTDGSNFSSVTGIGSDGAGSSVSARELYKVNGNTKVTAAGAFRSGNVTAGTFTIGNKEFTITDDTTINDVVNMINSAYVTEPENIRATAYWDSLAGNIIIQSQASGAQFINVETGTSNLTDILGLTYTDNIHGTKGMNTDSQELGSNAVFKINGTTYTSASNTVDEDVSKLKGVTLTLKDVTEGETISLRVEQDKETLADAVEEALNSYNELMTAVDESIAKGGSLEDQTSLKRIRDEVKRTMSSYLTKIGITTKAAAASNISTSNSDIVNLVLDRDTFYKELALNPAKVKTAIVGDWAVIDDKYQLINEGAFSLAEQAIERATSGYFIQQSKSYDNQISRLNDRIKTANAQITRYKAMLERKFSAMETLISAMQRQYQGMNIGV